MYVTVSPFIIQDYLYGIKNSPAFVDLNDLSMPTAYVPKLMLLMNCALS